MRNTILLAGLLLGGCAATMSTPPPTPTPVEIGLFGNSVIASGLTPGDYLNYGLTLASTNCAGWFGKQVAGANNNSMLQQLLALGGAAAAVGGGPIGTGAAAAAAMGAGAIGIYQSNQPAGPMPAIIYTVVQKELQAFAANMPMPVTLGDAAALVEAFSEKCQQADISSALISAITTAPVSVVQPFFPTASSRAYALTPQRVLPPVVVVGTPPGPPTLTPPQEEDIPAPLPRHRRRVQPPPQATVSPAADDRIAREWAEIQKIGRATYETARAGP